MEINVKLRILGAWQNAGE